MSASQDLGQDPILDFATLGFPWQTPDPFLFCVHHDDAYPSGAEDMGPTASLAGRNIGTDFSGKDGWSMYHGERVPGFPSHPHRGFETVTIVRQGYIDHSDSLGATARFGPGDVQWLTTGAGIVHSEMFPLVNREAGNHTELFQIWLNLPASDKFVDPYFTMLWADSIPELRFEDGEGRLTTVRVIAGRLGDAPPPKPPPNSWAARADAHVAIWTLRMQAGANWTLPPSVPGVHRMLYLFRGAKLRVGGRVIEGKTAMLMRPDVPAELQNDDSEAELLMLQGRPIGEPVVQHGPFVMNEAKQIEEAIRDYRRTRFGGWPWDRPGPVHPREATRFAIHADGRREDR